MSKKSADTMVSAAGWITHLVVRITDGLRERGWSNDQIHALVTDEGTETIDKIVEAFLAGGWKLGEALRVTVDYDRSVEDGVRAGRYDYANPNITSKNFPASKSGTEEIEVVLVHFDRLIGSEKATEELRKRGLRPAELPELLAVGEQYSEKQRDFPIVALGPVWRVPDGDLSVPCLRRLEGERDLDLGWFGGDWFPGCRFAAVRT